MMLRSGHSNLPSKAESPSQLTRSSAPQLRPGVRQRTKTAPPENGGGGAPIAAVAQEQTRGGDRIPPPPSSWKRRQGEH